MDAQRRRGMRCLRTSSSKTSLRSLSSSSHVRNASMALLDGTKYHVFIVRWLPAHVFFSKLACVSASFYRSLERLSSLLAAKLSPLSVGLPLYDAHSIASQCWPLRSPLYARDCHLPHRYRLLNRCMYSLHACTCVSDETVFQFASQLKQVRHSVPPPLIIDLHVHLLS
jgi:hypothetical protein